MKTIAFLIACIATFSLVAMFSFNTDPFETRNAMHSITEMSPSVALANSSSLNSGRMKSTMTWVGDEGQSYYAPVNAELAVVSEDYAALCDSPSEAMLEHPRYEKICN